MAFLNSIMLFGLIAASIPLIIHLLNRRRQRIVHWAAMRFLRLSFVTRHKRIRIEELILLILRTALLVALVLGLARPTFYRWLASSEGNRKDVAVVLDCSFSMSLEQRGASMFDRARQLASQAVRTLSEGDSVGVVLATGTPRLLLPELSYDFDQVDAALQRVHESLGSLDVPKCLDRALALLSKGRNPVKQIIVITDGQRHGWFPSDNSRWAYLSEHLAQFERPPAIRVLTLPREEAVANDGLGEIALRRTVVGTDRDVTIHVKVANTGELPFGPRKLTFAVDGRPAHGVQVERLMQNTSTTLSFKHRFTEPGGHYVSANIEKDMLPADDATYLGVEVLDALPVLLVNGTPAPDPMRHETLFLASALEPTPRYVVNPTVIDPSQLAKTDLDGFRVVVLANVGQPGAEDVAKLEAFARAGGGVLIAPGDQVNADVYNATLWRRGEGLLPAQIESIVGDAKKKDEAVEIYREGLTHETLQVLADPDKSDLNLVRVYRRFKYAEPPAGAPANVVAKLLDGSPLLVEKPFGRGRVMAIACPVDADWSNLPLRTSYVVLMHELIYYLSSPLLPARAISAGAPLVVTLGEAAPADEVELELPMGRREVLPVSRRDGRRVAIFGETDEAGLYRVSYEGRQGPVREYYVVNFDPAESDLAPLAESARELVANHADVEFFDSWAAVERSLAVGQSSREIWKWLALATLGMLFVELVLTRLFSRRKAGAETGVSFGTG